MTMQTATMTEDQLLERLDYYCRVFQGDFRLRVVGSHVEFYVAGRRSQLERGSGRA